MKNMPMFVLVVLLSAPTVASQELQFGKSPELTATQRLAIGLGEFPKPIEDAVVGFSTGASFGLAPKLGLIASGDRSGGAFDVGNGVGMAVGAVATGGLLRAGGVLKAKMKFHQASGHVSGRLGLELPASIANRWSRRLGLSRTSSHPITILAFDPVWKPHAGAAVSSWAWRIPHLHVLGAGARCHLPWEFGCTSLFVLRASLLALTGSAVLPTKSLEMPSLSLVETSGREKFMSLESEFPLLQVETMSQ